MTGTKQFSKKHECLFKNDRRNVLSGDVAETARRPLATFAIASNSMLVVRRIGAYKTYKKWFTSVAPHGYAKKFYTIFPEVLD